MHGEEEGMVEEGMGAPPAGTEAAEEGDGGWEAFYNRFKGDQRVRRELELDRGLREFLKSPEARDEATAFRRLDEYSRARFGLDAERGDAWNADRKPFGTAAQYADALVGITRRGYEAVASDEWRAWAHASREERMRIAGVNPNKAAASDETPGAFATADAFAFQRVVPKTDAEIDAELADYGARIEGQNFLGVMRAYDARFGFTPDERALVRAALRHGDGLPEEMAWDFERVLRADPERGRALKDLVDRTRRTERRWWRDNVHDPFVGGFERIRKGLEDAIGEFAGPMALEAQMRALVGGSADSGRWWWNDAERAEYARLKGLMAADARVRAYAGGDPKRLVDNMCARRLAWEAVPEAERKRARRERVVLEDALAHKPTFPYCYASRTVAGILSTLPYMAVTAAPYAGFAANVLSQFETVRDGIILDGGDEDEAIGAQLLLAAGWAGIEKAQLGNLFGKPLTGLRRKAMLAKIYRTSWKGGRLAKIGAYARQGAKEAVASTLAESLEEGLQGAVEAGEMEWFAGRGGGHDGAATLAAALRGGAGDFVESLGTMGVLSLVGAGTKVGHANRDARGADSLAEYAAAALRAKNVLRGTVMDPERPGADVPEAARRAVQEVWSIWRRHREGGTGGVAALDEIRERYGLDDAQTRDVGDWLDLRDNLVEAARHADTDEEGRFVAGVAGGMFRVGAPGSHLDAQALYDVVLPGTKVEEVEVADEAAASAPAAEAAPSAELAAPRPTHRAQKVTLPTGESYILDVDTSSPDIDSEGWAQSVEQAMREALVDPDVKEKPADGASLPLDAFKALPSAEKMKVAVTAEQYLSLSPGERVAYNEDWCLAEGGNFRVLDEKGRELLGADGVVRIKRGYARFVRQGGNWELAHEHGHFIAAVASRHMTPGQIATMRRLFGDPTSENERWNEENANNQFAEWLRGKYDFRVFTPEERRARMNWFQRALDTIKHLFWLSGERPPAAPVEVTQREQALDAAFNALRSGDFSGLDVYAGIDFAGDKASTKDGEAGKAASPDVREAAATPLTGKAENPAPAGFQAGYDAAVAAMNANPQAFADSQPVRTGGRMTVFTPDYSMKVEAEPMWTPLASLVESTDDREVQMRDRTRAATDEQTHSKTRPGVFQPLALFPGSKSDDGAPIVGGGNRIVSGHGRKRMLDILAQEGRFGEYLDAVAAEAARRGLPPPPDGMETPVLVLRVTGGLDRRADLVRFAELSNRWGGLERSGAEFAESDARKITDALLRFYAPDAGGNLLAASNRPFMAAFLRAVGATGLTNADGTPTPEAALRVQRALMTAVFGNDEKVRSMVQSLLEKSGELSLASLQNALMRSAGRLLAMKRQKGSFDIVSDVCEAAYQYIAWRVAQQKSPKLTLADHLRQGDFFSSEVPPMQQALARLLDAGRFGETMEKYNDLVAQQAVDAQATFGFFEAKTPLQLLGEAERALLAEGETPVTPDPASPESAAPVQTPPAVQAEPEDSHAPDDALEAAQAEIAPPEPETFVPVPAVRGTATLPGPGAEGVRAHQVDADGRPTTAVRTLPPGAWNLLRAPYDVRRPPKPSGQDRAGRGLGISNPPPATDSAGRSWGGIFPHFQGNKAEMADRTTQAIRNTMAKAERDHYTTVVDYFGGGGCWGLYHALTNFENARELVVNEFDPDRLEKIRLLHEIDGQLADEAEAVLLEPRTLEELRVLAANSSSPTTIASKVDGVVKRRVSDGRVRAALQAFVDCAHTMLASATDADGAPVKGVELGVRKALAALREDGRRAKEAADAFKARGGTIKYRSGDAASFGDAPTGHRVVAVCDPPYYLTQDYQQGTILGLDPVPDNWSYAATQGLLHRLADAGCAIVYTDEAWWNKKDYANAASDADMEGLFGSGILDEIAKNETFRRENGILLDIINTLDHFDVAGRVAGRQEVLGVHHGHERDDEGTENGAGRDALRPEGAADAGGERGARHAVQRVAGLAEEEGRTAWGTRPHRGREGRVALAGEVVVQDIAASVGGAARELHAEARHSVGLGTMAAVHDFADGRDSFVENGYGRIAYEFGEPGHVTANGRVKGGHGLLHIVYARMVKDGATLAEAVDTAIRVGDAIETGSETLSVRNKKYFRKGDVEGIFADNGNGKLVLTGYKLFADGTGGASLVSPALRTAPPPRKGEVVAAINGWLANRPTGDNVPFHAPEVNTGTAERIAAIVRHSVRQVRPDRMADYARAVRSDAGRYAEAAERMGELPIPPDMRANADFADVRFSVQMGNRAKEEARTMIKKYRPDVLDYTTFKNDEPVPDRNFVIDQIAAFPTPKERKAALLWFCKNTIRLPEDAPKVREAIKTAERAKVDPMQYDRPGRILEQFAQFRPKEPPINPDTVGEFNDRRDMGHGIVTYAVPDTKEAQAAVRRIINTHWGRDANPWCLAQGDGEGNLTDSAWHYWNNYNALPKRIAFRDGRLTAFMATNRAAMAGRGEAEMRYEEAVENGEYIPDKEAWIRDKIGVDEQWWDRADEPHGGIPFLRSVPSPTGEGNVTQHCELAPDGTAKTFKTTRGNPNAQNGTYEEWLPDGSYHMVRRTGGIISAERMTDGNGTVLLDHETAGAVATGPDTAQPRHSVRVNPDMSKPENAKAFRGYLDGLVAAEMPSRLTDGRPRAALEWFEKNLVGRTFPFDIPGIGHREFRVNEGHLFRLVCDTPADASVRKGYVAEARDAADARRRIRAGLAGTPDVAGWNESRARSLPLLPHVLKSFDAVLREKARPGFLVFVKKFVSRNGHVNTVVMRLNEDGATLGPMSAHMKGITDSWLKKQDLTVTDDGKVFNTRPDNSANGQVDAEGVDAEGNPTANARSVPHSADTAQGGSIQLRHSVFIGEKGVDRVGHYDTLAQAREMLDQAGGEYSDEIRDEIYTQTGWFIGTDGLWRFEIGDLKPKTRFGKTDDKLKSVNGLHYDGSGSTWCLLPAICRHEEIFKLYPQLKDIKVNIVDPDEVDFKGQFDPGEWEITIDWDCVQWKDDDPTNVLNAEGLKTLTHELQHAVQELEQFAKGGSPETVGRRNYRRLAGEVEARNTENRSYGTYGLSEYEPDDRAEAIENDTTPWRTQDVPSVNQLLYDGYGKLTDRNGNPVKRASVRRGANVHLGTLAESLLAQRILAGKEPTAREADGILKSLGLYSSKAPETLARAKELADEKRGEVQKLVRDNAPEVLAALAQAGLERQYREVLDGAITGTAKAVDPSVGREVQRPHPARTVPGRLTPDDRPAGANRRSRFGHYEMDTVVSSAGGRGGLLVLVDRRSRRYVIEPVAHVTQDEVVRALKRMVRRGALGTVRSVTTDNGCEFLDPDRIRAVVGCDVYYTRAYASWEKGSVENCNRLVRRWYPKGTDFGRCTRAEMHRLERVINSIHRRLLGGKTAYEYDTAYARTA